MNRCHVQSLVGILVQVGGPAVWSHSRFGTSQLLVFRFVSQAAFSCLLRLQVHVTVGQVWGPWGSPLLATSGKHLLLPQGLWGCPLDPPRKAPGGKLLPKGHDQASPEGATGGLFQPTLQAGCLRTAPGPWSLVLPWTLGI